MEQTRKPLSAKRVEQAKYEPLASNGRTNPGALLPNRIPDKDGLYLAITPHGAKSWRYDFRFPSGVNGRRCVLVYGKWPAVSLEKARKLHDKAKELLAEGKNPALQKRIEKQRRNQLGDNTFRSVGQEWYAAELRAASKSAAWEQNYSRWLKWAYEDFGNRALPDIEAADVLALVKRIEQSGKAASAEYCRQTVARVFDYGITQLRAPRGFNPAAAISGAVIVPDRKHHEKLNANELPDFLKALDGYTGPEALKLGVKILLHIFPRKVELSEAPWAELDLDAGLWSIAKERMKTKKDHVIPLSPQVVAMFRRLKELAGDAALVFPASHDPKKPMPKDRLNRVINEVGYEGKFTPHGARGTAASILADAGYDVAVIDAQLAHSKKDQTQAAYFRNTYLDKRRELLCVWSSMLDNYASGGAKVIPIKAA